MKITQGFKCPHCGADCYVYRTGIIGNWICVKNDNRKGRI